MTYQKLRTTDPGYLSVCFLSLVDLNIDTALNHGWVTVIIGIPLEKEFLYLVAIVDLFSSTVLS